MNLSGVGPTVRMSRFEILLLRERAEKPGRGILRLKKIYAGLLAENARLKERINSQSR